MVCETTPPLPTTEPGSELGGLRQGSLDAEDVMHSSQESGLLTEESISSMDIDMHALDKVGASTVFFCFFWKIS